MSVLGRLLVGSQQRVDLADFLSIQSYVASDFKELVRSFVGSRPVILKGFEVIDAPNSIGTNSISIRVADSVLYDPTAAAGSFFSGLPEGNALSQPLVLGQELRPGAVNYIYLTLSTVGAAQDTRAFWDVDLNGGEGGEFNQTINTEAVLIVQAGVSTAGFPQGTIPVAKVNYSTSITEITDCRNLMYRLGTGGTSPDPNARFQFPPLPSAPYARSEPPSTINSAALPSPFFGGDKNIETLKDWMDAVMTKLVELSGTTYWYESTGDLSLVNVFDDALASSLKSKGKWQHSETTIGQVTWTEDIQYRKINDPRDIIIRAGTKTLLNEQIMWVQMVRNQKINPLDTPVTFITGAAYVNGAAGSFSSLAKGDWIKQKGDDEYLYARVVGFYNALNGSGSETTASAALSVKLEDVYGGVGGLTNAVYTKGVYENSDVQITDRDDFTAYNAGGNLYWLASRSDTIQKVGGIVVEDRTSTTIDSADGKSAKITFAAAHNLVEGDRVVVSNGTAFDGTYIVEIVSSTEVTIQTTATGSTSSATVGWAVVTSAARPANNSSSFIVESANHGFATGQKVVIAGVTPTVPDINGSYLVNVRNLTQFQIPYGGGALSPTLSAATVTCAKVILKTELGAVEVVQGETIDINEPDTKNLLSFIGMGSLAETNPVYVVPEATNNMLDGYSNYNSVSTDSLTTRVSRLTAMMADRVQDRGLRILGRMTFRNEGSGSDQIVTLSGDTLVVMKPGSASQSITAAGTYTLVANTAVVVDIDRNGSAAVVPSVVGFDANFLLQENRIVLFYRMSGTEIYSWDGSKILNSTSWTSNEYETSQNRNVTVFEAVGTRYDGTDLYFLDSVGYVYIKIPGSTNDNRIDVSNFTSGITVADDYSVWVRINRRALKTFTNLQTSATYQDSDAAGALYVTTSASVPTDQDVVVLYSVQGGMMIRHHMADLARQTVYEEYYVVSGNHSSPYTIQLPLDSRNGSVQAYYITGSGQLEVYLNGQKLEIGNDYDEVGSINTAQASVDFIRDDGLVDGDVIAFRLAAKGGLYTIDLGTTTTLQQAYDMGANITIDDGTPVTINASAGYKALQLNGDLGVTGVIDPLGLEFTLTASNPLNPANNGLWVDTSGHLIHERPSFSPSSIDITESITNPASFLVGGDGIDILVDTISVDLSAVPGLEFDTGKLQAKVDPAGSVVVGVDGLAVQLEATDPTLEINGSNELGVKLDPAGAIVTDASGILVQLEATDPTLEINGSNELGVKLDATGSIVTDTDGIKVQLEATNPTLQIDGSNQLGAKLDAAGAIVTGTNGLSVAVDGVTLQIQGNQLVVSGVPNLLSQFTNNTGSAIAAGSVVAAGAVAGEIVLASASDLANSAKIVGIAYAIINDGDPGLVLTSGIVTIPGSSFTPGQPVYLSPSVAGGLTTSKPNTYGQAIMIIGVATGTDEMTFKPSLVGVASNVYLESDTLAADYTATQTVTLPVDSRAGSAIRYYTVGDAMLTVWLNGQKLKAGLDYNEVGSAGTQSNQIDLLATIDDPYVTGDVLEYRIERDQAMVIALAGL